MLARKSHTHTFTRFDNNNNLIIGVNRGSSHHHCRHKSELKSTKLHKNPPPSLPFTRHTHPCTQKKVMSPSMITFHLKLTRDKIIFICITFTLNKYYAVWQSEIMQLWIFQVPQTTIVTNVQILYKYKETEILVSSGAADARHWDCTAEQREAICSLIIYWIMYYHRS